MWSGIRRTPRRRATSVVTLAIGAISATSCLSRADAGRAAEALQLSSARRPDELPVMLNRDAPFRYPSSLFASRVQGNVTLRIFIDRDGHVHPDSTRVEESSGIPALDSAALRGATELRFVPAKRQGEPMPTSILFPVYFRHPDAPPLPGDSAITPRHP